MSSLSSIINVTVVCPKNVYPYCMRTEQRLIERLIDYSIYLFSNIVCWGIISLSTIKASQGVVLNEDSVVVTQLYTLYYIH